MQKLFDRGTAKVQVNFCPYATLFCFKSNDHEVGEESLTLRSCKQVLHVSLPYEEAVPWPNRCWVQNVPYRVSIMTTGVEDTT